MEQIYNYLIVGTMVILGGLPTLYLTLSIPAVIGYKIYRKVRYHISIMN